MGRIIDFLLKMPDKLAHFAVCLVGSFVFGFSFGLGASIAAEFKDKAHGGRWDWLDLWAGVFGSVVGGFIHFLILRELWLV